MDEKDKKIRDLLSQHDSDTRYEAPAQEWSQIRTRIEESEKGHFQIWLWAPLVSGLLVFIFVLMPYGHDPKQDEEIAEFLADSYRVLEEEQTDLLPAYRDLL